MFNDKFKKMKNLIAFKVFVVGFFALVGFSLISCVDDYEPIPVKLEDVNGNYKARLFTTQGNIKDEKTVELSVKKDTVIFNDFPIKEIVKTVVTNPVKAEAALTAIGKVKYKLNYTSTLNTTNNVVELNFAPKTLVLQIPVDGVTKNTIVKIAAPQKGFYVGQDRSLRFGVVAEKITVDGVDLTPYEIIKYDFPYCVKN